MTAKTYDELIFGIGQMKNRYTIFSFVLLNISIMNPDIYAILFILLPTNFRCNWPATLMSQNITHYMDLLVTPNITSNSTFDNQCSAKVAGLNTTVKCQHFIYESNASMVSEFNLVCDSAFWVNMIKGGLWMGYLCATPIGILADKFGRKPLLVVLSYLNVLVYYVCALSNGPLMYLVFHFIKGFCLALMYLYIILQLELSNVDGRRYLGAYWIGNSLLALTLSPIAYLLQNWRYYQYYTAATVTPLLIIPFLYPESPRWLLVKNKKMEAQKALDWLAVKNKQPKVNIQDVSIKAQRIVSCNEIVTHKPMLIRVVFAVFLWFSTNAIFYGIAFNVKFASDNPYISMFTTTVAGLPVIPFVIFICWFTTHKRAMYFLISVVIGSLLVVSSVQDYPVARLIIGFVGKFSASSLFSVVIIFTEELFPTEFRSTGQNFTNLSRISVVIVSYIIDLKSISIAIPTLIFSVIGILMLISIMPFPETKGWHLPQKVEDLRKIQWSNINQAAGKQDKKNHTSNALDMKDNKKELEVELIQA